jgi:hypothetical protein
LANINKKLFSHLNVEDNDPVWERFAEVEFSKKNIFSDNKAYLLEDGLVRKYYISSSSDIDTEVCAEFYFPVIFLPLEITAPKEFMNPSAVVLPGKLL